MHNALTRLQTTFGFFTSCAFTLASIIALLSILPIPAPSSPPTAFISAVNVQVVKGRPHYYSTKREEYAQIRFDLDADLSGLFTWNTKQIFVYVTANYPGAIPEGAADGSYGAGREVEMNEAVIWDIIIPCPTSPWSLENLKTRYITPYITKAGKSSTSSSRKKPSTSSSSTSSTSKIKALTLPGRLHLTNQKPKYAITDPTGIISERGNATLQVSWNVQPWVGALVWDVGYLGRRVAPWATVGTTGKGKGKGKGTSGRSETFEFPALKGKPTQVVKDPDGPRTPEGGGASPVVGV